jgi:hypothetical protein
MNLHLVPWAVAACILTWASAGQAWVQSESTMGAGLHWEEPCLAFYLHEDGSDEIEGDGAKLAMLASLDEWSGPNCSAMVLQYAGTTNYVVTGYVHEEDPINLVIWRESEWPYAQRPIAFTSVTYDPVTGVIVDADIELNGEDYAFTADPATEPFKIDVQNTVTHEMGHVLGLDHTTDPFTTMYTEAMPGETLKRTLEQDDVDGLCTLYPVETGVDCPLITVHHLEVEPKRKEVQSCSTAASSGGFYWLALLAPLVIVRLRRRDS